MALTQEIGPENAGIYAFGPFRVDSSERRLTRDGIAVALPPKAFDLLVVLIKNHGHVVSKDELMGEIWPDAFVEEANLTVTISTLRKALGDSPSQTPYIVTVPKHGYRFDAAVERVPREALPAELEDREYLPSRPSDPIDGSDAGTATPIGDLDRTEDVPPGGRMSRVTAVILTAAALLAVTVLSWAVWTSFRGPSRNETNLQGPIDSIAVLPFEGGAQDVNADYLRDGITESLRDRFSQLSGLRVASRSSSFRYKDKEQDIVKVGDELKVRAVLTGSVKQLGDQLIISVRLDDALTNQHIWGQQYVRPSSDIITVQNEIAQDVTSNLRLKLTGEDEQRLAKRYTDNSEAYQLYLKGNYEWNKHTEADLEKAIAYYEKALEKDPRYALAYAGLSASYGQLANIFRRPNDNFPKAKAYAAKALDIDDTLAEAHGAMAAVRLFYDWDWAEAEKEFKRAQELEPNYGDAHQLYAAYLETSSRFVEARAEAEKARQLDPLSPMFSTEVGIVDYFARDYDRAIPELQETLTLEPHYTDACQYLGQSYEAKRMYPEAISTFLKCLSLNPSERPPALIASLGHAYASSGDKESAMKCIAELRAVSATRYVSPYLFAVVWAGLDNKDEAFNALEMALSDRTSLLIWLKVESQFDPLRSDPRFTRLLQRIGLEG